MPKATGTRSGSSARALGVIRIRFSNPGATRQHVRPCAERVEARPKVSSAANPPRNSPTGAACSLIPVLPLRAVDVGRRVGHAGDRDEVARAGTGAAARRGRVRRRAERWNPIVGHRPAMIVVAAGTRTSSPPCATRLPLTYRWRCRPRATVLRSPRTRRFSSTPGA